MDKSHVSMEQKMCLVCGHPFDTNAILLDMKLRQSMDRHTVTGFGLCPEHQARYDEGYVALVACDASKTPVRGGTVAPQEVHRTGEIAHINHRMWEQLFNTKLPMEGGRHTPVAFVEQEVIQMLKKHMV